MTLSASGETPTHIHPPKIEIFDVAGMTNTDPKGFVRRVDEYRIEPFGLYMARRVVDHPRVSYFESWLLPEFGLRVSDWWWRPGQELDQDFYLDVVGIDIDGEKWTTTDLYLDLVVRTGRAVEVVDSDELLAAVKHGLLDETAAERALEIAYRAVAGIARCDYDVTAWMAEHQVHLTWRRR